MNYNTPMFKNQELKDKIIIVTGGATGLGLSMVKYFLKCGAKVLICSRKEDILEGVCDELSKTYSESIKYAVCDVRKYLEVDNMLQIACSYFGEVNVLVNNAAGNFVMPTERLSPKAFDVVVDIVLKGTYNCSLAFGKYCIDKKISANMLNIVTTYSFTGSAYVVPSAAAKGGVLALTKSLAVEWAKYNIRCNAIAPGPFPTEGAWSRLFPEAIQKSIDPLARIPLKRFGEHQELANLAGYMISDYAAYMNGETVVLDGGEWLQGAGQFSNLSAVPKEAWDIWEQNRK
jgi:NAD(P)-dependent dehydrogenase (short-subunit alcohol dehydrogenase family)